MNFLRVSCDSQQFKSWGFPSLDFLSFTFFHQFLLKISPLQLSRLFFLSYSHQPRSNPRFLETELSQQIPGSPKQFILVYRYVTLCFCFLLIFLILFSILFT